MRLLRKPGARRAPRRPGFSRLLLLPALGAVAALSLGYGRMMDGDSEHARFYETGTSVKGFLGDYCKALEADHAGGRLDEISRFYADDFHAAGRGRWVLGESEQEGGVEVAQLRRAGAEDFDRGRRLEELGAYLATVESIDESACKIHLIEEAEPDLGVTLTVRFVLAGTDARQLRIEDRHFFRWHLDRQPDASDGVAWKIASDELVGGSRTAGPGAFLELDPVRAGVDYRHRRDPKLDREKYSSELRFDVAQHASGGISAADYNGDGRPDLFFADGIESRLYRNDGAVEGLPRFTDVTAEAGLAGIDQAHAAVFFDLDNDGDRDLFVTRYLAPSRIYRNEGGTFEDASAAMGLELTTSASSVTVLDFDRDGFLDLYVGAYGDAFEAVPRLPFFATNGGRNLLLRNEGGQSFTDVSAASGADDSGWSLAVAAGDYDGDGWTDLAVANDFGRKTLLRNNADGTFTDLAREAGVLDFSGGMGLAFGDYDDDGRLDLYTSNIYSNQRWYGEDQTISHYLRNVLRTRWAVLDAGEYWRLHGLIGDRWRELGQMIGEGNSVFHNEGGGRFSEIKDTPASFAGWSWGVVWLDFDNDRDLDLYAANGWISATPYTDL